MPRASKIVSLMASLIILTACAAQAAAARPLEVGVGEPGGASFVMGRAVVEAASRAGLALRLAEGFNDETAIEMLAEGNLDFAVVGSDKLCQAVAGQGYWRGEPQTGLRAVCGLAAQEYFIDRAQADLLGPDDKGLRLRRAVAFPAISAGAGPNEPPPPRPAALIERAADGRLLARFVVLEPGQMARVVGYEPCLARMTIPPAFCRAPAGRAWAVRATLVTRADAPATLVERLAKALAAAGPRLAKACPGLEPAALFSGLAAPAHAALEALPAR
ncbi:hypothetical protein Deba_2765 [Desulfarculus baarsii DSM 2075]|uniref:Uncharacterized protein n=1 Tax=Desulfarculus baarsii (strain ATCC 33931 / DSM 2075 / LMG 7858 / VKM B-1802 / 2st14) TaxID=644282 RepID=E1QM76_DESB2|nr:hypothetical protein [Desulfarculus baarsii]ADK86119.1 hypothetical protein Deba_2765 [Desulfarculus baarsii DSM 2075]